MTNTQLEQEHHTSPSQSPASRKTLELLSVFVGRWTTEGHQHEGMIGPAAAIVAEESYEWLAGEQFLVHRFDGHVGDGVAACIEIIGHDAETNTYPTRTYYNTGVVNEWRATATERVWTLSGEWKLAKAISVRCTTTVSHDGRSLSGKWEWADASTAWQTFWDVTSTRVG